MNTYAHKVRIVEKRRIFKGSVPRLCISASWQKHQRNAGLL
jgi:hypothetical protein